MLQIEFTRLSTSSPSVNPNTFSIIKRTCKYTFTCLTHYQRQEQKWLWEKTQKRASEHITGKKIQKWASMGKNLTITISFRMPIFTWNSGLEPSKFSGICIMGPSGWKMSYSFLFLKTNFEKPQAYIIYTHILAWQACKEFCGVGIRRRERKKRHYQGLEAGGKSSAAVKWSKPTVTIFYMNIPQVMKPQKK